MKLLNLLLLSAACCGAAAQAADSYPTKSIELVVSYQPGGGSDNTARAIADAARPLMPQSVVVLNRPGGSGSIGWSYVAGSDDGYRLILMTPEMLVVPLMGIGKVTVGDFQPIARFTDDPSSITVRADAPWRTAQEFIQYAKANPGKVAFSNAGNGTIPHVAAGAFAEAIGAQLEHIPYNGSAPAIMGLLAGDVQATTVAYAELRQHVESGKLRTLAVMSKTRGRAGRADLEGAGPRPAVQRVARTGPAQERAARGGGEMARGVHGTGHFAQVPGNHDQAEPHAVLCRHASLHRRHRAAESGGQDADAQAEPEAMNA